MFFIDLIYILVFIVLSPWWLAMLVLKPAFREGFWARFSLPENEPSQHKSVWLHGSSAGEVDLLRPLVNRIEQQMTGCEIVVSVFAISGYAAAKKAFPKHRVIYFPADFSFVIRRFLKVLQPQLVVLVESEFWPNFIVTANRASVPVCLINGRMSDKSFRVHQRLRLVAWALRKLSLLAVQTDGDASRFRDLGVAKERLSVTGNMKYDLNDLGRPEEWQKIRSELRLQYAIDEDMTVSIGGSLHRGEDLALATAYARLLEEGYRLRMIIVPRYPAESAGIGRVLEQQGLVPQCKSSGSTERYRIDAESRQVLIVDTLGELKNFYAMSDVAYVGGSLTYRGSNKGGHNLMEPASMGLAVMFGPYNYSFRETVRDLLEARAGILVHDADEIYSSLKGLLDDPATISDLGGRAREVISKNRGASARNITLLSNFIPLAKSGRGTT